MNKKMTTRKLIQENINNGTDFEFYPTTREILEAMYWDIYGPLKSEKDYRAEALRISLLDIGAGNCKLYETFKEIADSQPILEQYFYHETPNKDYYEKYKLINVISLENYRRSVKCTIEHKEEGTIQEEILNSNDFMIVYNNSDIVNLDFSNLDYMKENQDTTEEKYLLQLINTYEKPKSYRNDSERMANRIYFDKYMAIEKSQTLIDNMPNNVFVVGTDFNENTLIDKKADYVFCNPPYSEFSQWSERIIKESNAKVIYLVIPKRWGCHGNIAYAIKQRSAAVSIVGNFDFLESEDRKARAKVSLVKIDLRGKAVKPRHGYRVEECRIDPFDLWFNETFKINAKKTEESDYTIRERKAKEHKENVKNALVNGSDLVSSLVELYNQDLKKLTTNYLKVSELDADLLKELNVDVKNLLNAFKEKIEGLKNLYWKEIFSNLDSITSRLTSRTRESLLNTLMSNTNIDFTTGNIRSVVIWVIKNSSKYFNSQMLQVYDDFTTEEGIKLYKSNANFLKDGWRYCKSDKKNLDKYALDYRIVCHGYRSEYSWDREENLLADSQKQYIKDIVIIAKNLGFTIDSIYYNYLYLKEKHNTTFKPERTKPLKVGTKTLSGKIEEVYCQTHIPNENGERVMEKDGVIYVYNDDQDYTWYQYKIGTQYYHEDGIRTENDVFTTIRGYGNGNVHFQFNQEFIKKLNLEVGRLRGWLKTPQEAAEEFDISLEEANKFWKSTYELLPSSLSHLLPQIKKEPSYKIESIENDEIGLYENEVLIYTSQNGAVLGLTDITLDDIPEDISNKFMNEVFENQTSKNKQLVDDAIDVFVDDVIDLNLTDSIEDEMFLKLGNDIFNICNGETKYWMTTHFTTTNEDYKTGKYDGLSRSIIYDEKFFKIIGFNIYRTKFIGKVPFVPILNSEVIISIEQIEELLETSNKDICSFNSKLRELIEMKNQSISVAKDDGFTKSITFVNEKTIIKETTIFDFI